MQLLVSGHSNKGNHLASGSYRFSSSLLFFSFSFSPIPPRHLGSVQVAFLLVAGASAQWLPLGLYPGFSNQYHAQDALGQVIVEEYLDFVLIQS